MKWLSFTLLIVLFSGCSATQPREKIIIQTKRSNPELVQPTPFSEGQINDYDVFEFLQNKPDRTNIVSYIGLPDSVWINDEQSSMVWYYFIEDIKDYNAVEINIESSKATGFEWD